jgi:hypothetical protein
VRGGCHYRAVVIPAQVASPTDKPCRVNIDYHEEMITASAAFRIGSCTPASKREPGRLRSKSSSRAVASRTTRARARPRRRRRSGKTECFRSPCRWGNTTFAVRRTTAMATSDFRRVIVTAQVGERDDSRITFVTKVVKLGDGPASRRCPQAISSPHIRFALR